MKKMKSIWTLLLTFVLLCSFSAVAYAESPPKLIEPPVLVASSQEESEPMEPLPEVVEVIPEPSGAPDSSEPETALALAEDAQSESTPTQEKSNTPYYVGAVFAVLLFAGVAVYCKCKGNR